MVLAIKVLSQAPLKSLDKGFDEALIELFILNSSGVCCLEDLYFACVSLCVFWMQVGVNPKHTSLLPTAPLTWGSRRDRGRAKVCHSSDAKVVHNKHTMCHILTTDINSVYQTVVLSGVQHQYQINGSSGGKSNPLNYLGFLLKRIWATNFIC